MHGRRHFLQILTSGACLFAMPGCGVLGENFPLYRYRITVEVNTPEGRRTGSSVIEVATGRTGQLSIPNRRSIIAHARGEAVVVDLGKRGRLFALLRSEDSHNWAEGVMFTLSPPVPREVEDRFAERFQGLLKQTAPIELPKTYAVTPYSVQRAYPMLVSFADNSDPSSLQLVDPDHLDRRFGEDVILHRIVVQLTDAPVTVGLREQLPWLDVQRGQLVKASVEDPAVLRTLSNVTEFDFIRGGGSAKN